MVIACPNCKRKYQIDTTRIPVGGTSFTCWSCRATVRVDPLGNTDASSQASMPPSRPPLPGRDQTLVGDDPDANVPPSAMRFFESLAAEATMTRQMASEDTAAPQTEPEPPRRVTGSIPLDALERLQGDDVLDLPPLEPILDAPLPVGDVIDLGLPSPEPAIDFGPVPAMPAVDAVPESRHTVAMGSLSAEDIAAAAVPVDLPAPRPVPLPIPLPPSISVTQPMSAFNVPAFGVEQPDLASDEVQDDQAVLPTAPFERPSSFEPTPGAVEPDRPVEFGAAPEAVRMTAAEMATNPQRAWVAPDVQAPEPRSRHGLLALAAVLVVAVCLGLAWQFVLKDFIVGRPSATSPSASATTPPTTVPATESGAPTPTPAPPPVEAPKPADPAVSTPVAPPEVPSKPTGDSGGFTIQIRSSPNETDAKQFADSLKAAGFDAYVMRADLGAKGIWYRVRVGRFQSREEAQREIGKLRSSAKASEAIIQPFTEG